MHMKHVNYQNNTTDSYKRPQCSAQETPALLRRSRHYTVAQISSPVTHMTLCSLRHGYVINGLEISCRFMVTTGILKITHTRKQNAHDETAHLYSFFFLSTTVLSQWNFFYGKFGLHSSGKASCDRVALPNLRCMQGVFIVSVIHRTLIWTTGSLACAQM